VSPVRGDSTGGRAYLDLQGVARRTHRPTAELLHTYALEGFLARLTTSAEAAALVLKGGLPAEPDDVLALVRRIAGVSLDDVRAVAFVGSRRGVPATSSGATRSSN
jgi:hypothetical protein